MSRIQQLRATVRRTNAAIARAERAYYRTLSVDHEVISAARLKLHAARAAYKRAYTALHLHLHDEEA